MQEVVYSADAQLRGAAQFLSSFRSDLRVTSSVAWRLFLRNLQAGYRQSVLGYLWLLVPTIITTATWVYLNSHNVLVFNQTHLPYAVYVLSGTLLWQVFAEALQSPLQQLSAARNILTKTRIPHEALLLAGVIEVVFNFAIRLIVFTPVLFWFKSEWNPAFSLTVFLVPLGVFSLLALGLSIGLLLAPLGLLYQDIQRGLSMFVVFWFFLTPIIYPRPVNENVSLLLSLNPVTPLLSATRSWLTFGTAITGRDFYIVIVTTLMTFVVAWLISRLARPHVVARLG